LKQEPNMENTNIKIAIQNICLGEITAKYGDQKILAKYQEV
jgi:hypothetical protein